MLRLLCVLASFSVLVRLNLGLGLEPVTKLRQVIVELHHVKWCFWHLQVFFAATGVSDGDLLRGVRYFSGGASTNSIVMRASSGTGECSLR